MLWSSKSNKGQKIKIGNHRWGIYFISSESSRNDTKRNTYNSIWPNVTFFGNRKALNNLREIKIQNQQTSMAEWTFNCYHTRDSQGSILVACGRDQISGRIKVSTGNTLYPTSKPLWNCTQLWDTVDWRGP